jgi:gas vesicle protein
MNKTLSFLIGAVIGAAVGASVAILLAPSSGEALRGQIQDEIERIQNEMTQAADQRRAELEEQLATLRAPRRPADMEANL